MHKSYFFRTFACKFSVLMKRFTLFCMSLAIASTLCRAANPAYLQYIADWSNMAIAQQQDYHIPVSITLAQGLLESAAGQSELAQQANNHFGIKCTSDWMGGVYRHDDETKDECFRLYLDASESFIDHSKFLQRSRYQRLFELDIRDYKQWAQGLKDCGYATDPLYPQKLIRIIEEYRLDTIGLNLADTTTIVAQQEEQQIHQEEALAAALLAEEINGDYHEPLSARQERKDFYAIHARQRMNGCTYVIARDGDTYSNIAFRLNMKERTLREYNDALGRTLVAGDRVYTVNKKRQGIKEHERLWVHPGETVWMVAQREGLHVDNLLKYNGLTPDVRVFKTRQVILLRKPKKQ